MGPCSSTVTIHGPTGLDRSHTLPWRNCDVRFCQSRAEMSLPTVNPAMAAADSAGPARRTVAPMTMTSSTSQSSSSTSGGTSRSSVGPSRVSAHLLNSVGWSGSGWPISRMWFR